MRTSLLARVVATGCLVVGTTLAILVGLLAGPVHAAQLSVGPPVLDLRFENGFADSSATPHAVTVKGSSSYSFVPGVTAGSSALKLGGGTYLSLGSDNDLLPSSLTLSFWLKPDTAMSGEQVITWNKQAYNSDGWYLSSESSSSPLALSVGPASGQPYKVAVQSTNRAAFFPAGQWTHIAVTFDAASKKATFYRNGVPAESVVAYPATGSATGVITPSTALPKTIGFNGPQYNGAYLTSALDEYKLFKGVAGISDVVSLFEAGGGTVDKGAIATQDADDLALPASASLALVLPAAGSRGSGVTWTSDRPEVVDPATGRVTQPAAGEDDATVTLTARVQYADGPVRTREFAVQVPARVDLLQDTGLDEVELTDDYLQNATAKEHDYLLSLSSKKFLYWFYRTAGLPPPTASGYGGWENGAVSGNFRGHAFGHYLSALAMAYASTSDPTTRAALHQQIVDGVDGLQEVQASYAGTSRAGYLAPFRESALNAVEGRGSSDDPVIVPYYNLHKVLAGLLDVNKYVDDATGDQALTIAHGFGEYVYGRMSTLSDKTTMRGTEYGGMNDALYDLYARTADPHAKVAAEAFDEVSLFRDLAANKDVLSGKHANTTIPKVLGALKRYTVLTQNPDLYAALTTQEKADLPMYLAAAQNFWHIVVNSHTYATGANSQGEHFHGAGRLYEFATQMGEVGNPQTAETCNEYNMLKLSRELFKLTRGVEYADFYENAFINTILSSQNPLTGMTTYFQAMAPGYYKLYALPFTDFWCCVGTGMENFSKLGDSLYFHDSTSVYVNLFLSSRYTDPTTHLRITQQADLPADDTVELTVEAAGGSIVPGARVHLRVPDWVSGPVSLTRNGEPVTPTVKRGYVVLTDLEDGDEFAYTLPEEVQVVETPDNPDFVAFKYGPTLLSASLGTQGLDRASGVGIGVRVPVRDSAAQQTVTVEAATTAAWKADIADHLVRVADSADGQVRFELRDTADGAGLVFTPHYRRHDERYALYLNIETADSAAAQARLLTRKQQERAGAFRIDSLESFDNNNFENAKGLKASTSSSVGVFGERSFRHAPAGGWFGYDLAIDPSASANQLQVRYYGGDSGRSFDVYVNDEKLKTQTITNAAGATSFYLQTDPIPAKFLQLGPETRYRKDSNGNDVLDAEGHRIPVVTVRFQSTGGWAGGVFGVFTTRPQAFDTVPDLSRLEPSVGTLSPAYDRAVTDYTLTVPPGTSKVGLELDPWVPSGLVRVDGVLVDDTRTRAIALDGTERTVIVTGVAQDHATAKDYTLHVVEGAAPTDTTAPVVTATTDPVAPTGSGGWFTGPVSLTLSATDDLSEVTSTEYAVGDGGWSDHVEPLVLPEGTTVVGFRATDAAGNVSAAETVTVRRDSVAPTTTLTRSGSGAVTLTSADATSGVAATTYRIDGGDWTTYAAPFTIPAPGTHTVEYAATDVAGNVEPTGSQSVVVDAPTAPVVVVTASHDPDGAAGWYITQPTVSASAGGATALQYRTGSGAWSAYDGQALTAPEGRTKYAFRARDPHDGSWSTAVTSIQYDATAPVATATFNDLRGAAPGPVWVALRATDTKPGSAVASIAYAVDGGGWQPYDGGVEVSGPGAHEVAFTATDHAGNTSAARSVTVTVATPDTAPPVLSVGTDPQVPTGTDGWHTGAVQLTATPDDGAGSGVARIEYRVGDSVWRTLRGPVAAPIGVTTYTVRATDKKGNVSATQVVTVKRDVTAPRVVATKAAGTVTLSATDAHSGPGAVSYRIDGGDWTTYTGPVEVTGVGTHTMEAVAVDAAGNVSAPTTTTVKLTR